MKNLKKLLEKRNTLSSELETMLNTCETETRAFNEEEQNRYNEIMTEIRSIDSTIDAAEAAEGLNQTEHRSANNEETHTQEELETRAFECYIRGIAPEVEVREASNMTAGDNGAVIPKSIARKIITKVAEISPLFARATKYNVGGTLTIPVYDESEQKITVAYATEFTALTSNSGKFASVSLTGFLAGALTKVSKSLINNSDFDIVNFVINRMAEAIALWIDGELLNGTLSKIDGLSKQAAAVTTASATAVTLDELIDLQETIPDLYQADAIWVMNKATRTAIRKLKNSDGDYILNKDANSKWGYTLFGHDVYTSSAAKTMASGNRAVFYLDPSGLAVKISEDMNIEVLREKFADEHAVGVIGWLEMDSKVEDAQKVAVMAMHA